MNQRNNIRLTLHLLIVSSILFYFIVTSITTNYYLTQRVEKLEQQIQLITK